MIVKFLKINSDARMPKRATDGAVGYDVYAPKDFLVQPGRNVLPLGFALEMPNGYEAKIEARSGFSSKGIEGLKPYDDSFVLEASRCNADVLTGKIDSDYRGNIGVIINNNDSSFYIQEGTRIAQLTFYKCELPCIQEVEELSNTGRGADGFGSTGSNDVQ